MLMPPLSSRAPGRCTDLLPEGRVTKGPSRLLAPGGRIGTRDQSWGVNAMPDSRTETAPVRRVVLAVSGGAHEGPAVRYAAEAALHLGAALRVVHVLPAILPVGPLVMFPDDSFQALATDVLERSRQRALASAPDLEVTTDLR